VGTSSFSILSNAAPLAHEGFAAHRALEALLRKNFRGEIGFDSGSRALYASDASNYRQIPIGVVCPRDAADVEAALAACRATGAAVLPRGGGTSLAGQCVNVALVFDYSRYMNGLTSLDAEARIARVEPGIVLDRLRDAAELHHLTYAPDPATHSRCTLGGMIGNNSCGVHGLMGGKTVDNVETLDVVLYDGTKMTVGPTPPEQLEALIRAGGRVGEIYAGLARLRDRYAVLVRERYPRIPRRVSGYNLDELLPEGNFNVARALVGSEGTCVNIVSATLNLTKSPPFRVLTVLGFTDAFLAADRPGRIRSYAGRLHAPQGAGGEGSRKPAAGCGLFVGRNGGVERGRGAGQGGGCCTGLAIVAPSALGSHLHSGGGCIGVACSGVGAGRGGVRSRRAGSRGGLGRCRSASRAARKIFAQRYCAYG
jgi:FAD/FMN-containing dehydrogenase